MSPGEVSQILGLRMSDEEVRATGGKLCPKCWGNNIHFDHNPSLLQFCQESRLTGCKDCNAIWYLEFQLVSVEPPCKAPTCPTCAHPHPRTAARKTHAQALAQVRYCIHCAVTHTYTIAPLRVTRAR